MRIISFLESHADLVGLISSTSLLIITAIYVIITWWQAHYTKKTLLESIKQNREEKQPYIVQTINKATGCAFDTGEYIRIQFQFNFALENVGDSSAVSAYTFLYALKQSPTEQKVIYAHLMPCYHHALLVGKKIKANLHFETDEFREIIEDLEINHAKNMKRIETDPSEMPFKGPIIRLRTLYQNMSGVWFESTLEQELLAIRFDTPPKDPSAMEKNSKITKKRANKGNVTNEKISDGDWFVGIMINPAYSRLIRRVVKQEYVDTIMEDCRKSSDSSLPYISD